MKLLLLGLLITSATVFQSDAEELPVLTGRLKTAVSRSEAEKFCQDLGMRLPTIREFAQFSQSLGAKGISEVEKDGYEFVKAVDSTGSPDEFYYSNEGYQRPAGDAGEPYLFWASSDYPDAFYAAYIFVNKDGSLQAREHYLSYSWYAVRCVK